MSDPLDRFRVGQLVPDNSTNAGQVFQLTGSSVYPTRVVGRDRWGAPIEETIPHNCGVAWVHPCGAINQVPMATAPTGWREPEQARYRDQLTVDLLRASWIPLEACPYSQAYRSITGTPCLIDNPDRIEDCGGKSDGCEHLRAVMKGRAERAREKHDAEHVHFASLRPADLAQMMQTMIEGIGNAKTAADSAPAPRPNTSAAKNRLVEGKGDQ